MENKFYILIIKNEDGVLVETVLNSSDDAVIFEDNQEYDVPQYEWRKSHHLIDWVKKNKPNWFVIFESVSFEKVLSLIQK